MVSRSHALLDKPHACLHADHVGAAGVVPSHRYSSKEQPSQQLIYLWTMGLQKAKPYVNCWMTERIQYTKPVSL